jgi:hypothetical protein
MPSPEKTKRIVSQLLLVFLCLSVGFAVGKEVTIRRAVPLERPDAPAGRVVKAYFFHGHPCITCLSAKASTEKVIDNNFAKAVAAGELVYETINYNDLANAALAAKFHVASNMIVLAVMDDGKVVHSIPLDRVMKLASSDVNELETYLRDAITQALQEAKR